MKNLFHIILYVFISATVSCADSNNRIASGQLNKKKNHSVPTQREYDSTSETELSMKIKLTDSIRMNQMGESDIKFCTRETYRFAYWIPYDQEFFLKVEQLADSTYLMTSKYYIPAGHNFAFPNATIPYKTVVMGNYIKGNRDSFIYFVTQQSLTKQDWIVFKKIIDGSYYWVFSDPMKDLQVIDAHSLRLSSKTILPYHISNDSLYYHENYVAIPIKGSYTDAYDFLARKSQLPKKIGIKSITILP